MSTVWRNRHIPGPNRLCALFVPVKPIHQISHLASLFSLIVLGADTYVCAYSVLGCGRVREKRGKYKTQGHQHDPKPRNF